MTAEELEAARAASDKRTTEVFRLHDAFVARFLPDLLNTSARGKWALLRNPDAPELVGIFDDHTEAYASGLQRFGLDEPLCISPIEVPRPTMNATWDFAVL